VAKGATRKRGEAKREALVLAAAELFWMRGFEASSLADIAEASGVPLGNVYYYFKTKADLAQAVADLFVQQTETLIEEVRAETPEPRRRLKLFIERLQDRRSGAVCNMAARFRPWCAISGRQCRHRRRGRRRASRF
jgi:AcrR family transcriptional regulator